MRYIKKLPGVEELYKDMVLSSSEQLARERQIHILQEILSGKDKRKLIIVGPCSADKEEPVLDYAYRLARLSDELKEKLVLVPRIYTGKPRTTGEGYKGMLHNPFGDKDEDLLAGIIAARNIHFRVIRETGLFSADEMLYPDEIYYMSDLLCYLAVGARSVEDQGHRMVASDDIVPVGMKNPTGGSKIVLINSIKTAQVSHRLIYRGWEVETKGNLYAHAILRGFTNKSGKNYPNYYYEDLVELHDMCAKNQIVHASVIIDCNHANSNKKYDAQPRIAKEVMGFCRNDKEINKFVKGLMIESYLEDGCQMIGQGIYGKSITDPCLGWGKTERLLRDIAENS